MKCKSNEANSQLNQLKKRWFSDGTQLEYSRRLVYLKLANQKMKENDAHLNKLLSGLIIALEKPLPP